MKYFLGIELAGQQLKIAVFIKLKKGYSVYLLDRLVLDKNFDKAKEQILNWKKSKLPKCESAQAVLSLPESSLYLKELTVPNVKEKQIKEAIKWEIVNSNPFTNDDSIIEYEKIESENSKIKILCVCARESSVEEYVSLLESAGINVTFAEPSISSFIRASGGDYEKNTLVMTVEEDETNLSILKKGIPLFTTSISTPLLPQKESKRKLNIGITNDLAEQASKTIKFWEEKGTDKISQVIIAGDIADKYYGLANAVNKITGIPSLMTTIKELSNTSFADGTRVSLLRNIIPIGAFYSFLMDKSPVNLLPVERKEAIRQNNIRENISNKSFALTIFNLVLFTIIMTLFFSLASWNKYMQNVEKQKKVFLNEHPAQQYISWVRETNSIAEITEKMIYQQKNIGDRLAKISEMVPSSIVLSSIDFGQLGNEEWKIKGLGDRDNILGFYEKIATDGEVKEVTMPYSNLSKEQGNEFEIKILW